MHRMFIALRALFYMAWFVLLWGWLALSVQSFDRSLGIVLPARLRTPGIFLMLAGGLLALACVMAFAARGRGTPAPFDAPREFVAVGPYRYVRNPMYIGAAVVLFGFGLYLRSVSVLLLSLGFLLLAHLFVVFYEEPHLEGRFGEAYKAYRRDVSRWRPREPRSASSH